MKIFNLIVGALLLTTSLVAQQSANLVFFTEQGEQFFVILNGAQQNETPETQVKITDLKAEFYMVRIKFADANLGEFNRNISVDLGNEMAIAIRKNNKGAYVFRPISSTPLAEAPRPSKGQRVMPYNPNGVSPGGAVIATEVMPNTQMNTTIQVDETNPNGERVRMDVNIGGLNMNVDVQVDEPVSTTTSTTTRTTRTGPATTTSTQTRNSTVTQSRPATQSQPAQRCNPMSEANFTSALNSIKSKGFDETRLTVAKQINNANCLTSLQVKRICELFSFEATSLSFAKLAYAKVFDPGNYFKVNDVFKFESSISELNDHIQNKSTDEDDDF